MPQWGRPSGARQRRQNREWQEPWEDGRFQELESSDGDEDEDDEAGVNIDIGQRRFAGDELLYTGADLGALSRGDAYHDYHMYNDGAAPENAVGRMMEMQLSMRDKEERLVETALARIRRAQMLGKTNVKLSQPEIDALERKRSREAAEAAAAAAAAAPRTPKGKKAIKGRTRMVEERPSSRSGRSNPGTPPTGGSETRRRRVSNAPLPYPVTPGDGPIASSNALPPIAYYGPPPAIRPGSSSSRGSSRTPSSQSLRQQASPQVPSYAIPGQPRYFSYPDAHPQVRPPSASRNTAFIRSLPDDPNWAPRSRSSSNVAYPDPAQFQAAYPPPGGVAMDPRYARRNPSAPTDFHRQSDELFIGTHSDPNLPTIRNPRQVVSNPIIISSDEDDGDDGYNGVEVEVVERATGNGYETRVLSGNAVASPKISGGGSASASGSGSPKKSSGRRRKVGRR